MAKILEAIVPATSDVVEVEETNADKFKRLGKKRTLVALDKIRLIGNLANKSIYEYSPEQVATIVKLLRDDIDALELKFAPRKHVERTFEL